AVKPARSKTNANREVFIGRSLLRSLRQSERDEERRGQGHEKHNEIDKSAGEKFERAEEPALPIDTSDRQEELRCEGEPKKSDDPASKRTWDHSVESDCRENDQHDPGVSKCVDVKRVN